MYRNLEETNILVSLLVARPRIAEHSLLLFRWSLVQLVAKLVERDNFVAALAEVAHYVGGESGLILIVQLEARLLGTYLRGVPWLGFWRLSSSSYSLTFLHLYHPCPPLRRHHMWCLEPLQLPQRLVKLNLFLRQLHPLLDLTKVADSHRLESFARLQVSLVGLFLVGSYFRVLIELIVGLEAR